MKALLNHKDFHKQRDFEIESKLSLSESLIKQLNELSLSEREIQISKLIIGCIDESGELTEDISQIEEISLSLIHI